METNQAERPNRFDESMGVDLGAVMHVLENKLVELQVVWLQYRQLFGTDTETIDLVNRTAGLFFQIVQDQLWDSVLLGISRMTDSASMGKNKNLTINSLPPLIADSTLRQKVEDLCKTAMDVATFAREHRHKRIAHRDHSAAVSQAEFALSGISRTNVEAMLRALREVLNAMNHHYRDTMVLYEDFVDYSGADCLLRRLRKLERLEKQALS